jgi:hypothetical protein
MARGISRTAPKDSPIFSGKFVMSSRRVAWKSNEAEDPKGKSTGPPELRAFVDRRRQKQGEDNHG